MLSTVTAGTPAHQIVMDEIRALPVKDMANVKRKWALSRSVKKVLLDVKTVGCKIASSSLTAWADRW